MTKPKKKDQRLATAYWSLVGAGATSWLKRIVITWIVLNSLGFIVTYLQPLIAGGNYTGP